MTVLMAAMPPHERPRERLLARGVGALTERELLALLLRSGAPGLSALDLAAELLAECGSLNRLASAEPEELSNRRGIGPAKAASIIAAFHLATRAEVDPTVHVVLRTAEDVVGVARREISRARRERVLVLICDTGNRLLPTILRVYPSYPFAALGSGSRLLFEGEPLPDDGFYVTFQPIDKSSG